MLNAGGPEWVNEPRERAPGVSHKTFFSASNQCKVGYSVYLPPSYGKTSKRLRLVLFLHGAGGSESSDVVPGGVTSVLEQAVADGAFPESVLVTANGRMSGYRDHPERGEFVETMIVRELLPLVEAELRAGGKRSSRFVAGFSMGGAGACYLSLKYPDLFAGAIAWGGSVRDEQQGVLNLVTINAPKLKQNGFRLFLAAGENDSFAKAPAFRAAMRENGISFEARDLIGIGHDLGAYYRLTASDAFRFIGR